jgi:phenylacetic acid degradation operon negative regulatory protein
MPMLSRMTARSVVLSVLLGAHPAWATASELIRLTADFDIREPTVRVTLTRMVSAGDLVRSDAINPRLRKWDGTWVTLVITSVGTDARTRAALRTTLQDKRFAELREGIWLRPGNLDAELTVDVLDRVRVLHSRDDHPAELAARLWDLPKWVRIGRELLDEMATATDIPGRFIAAAAIVRHLLTDPVLPGELLPEDWPGHALRKAYTNFAAELVARRDSVELMEAT